VRNGRSRGIRGLLHVPSRGRAIAAAGSLLAVVIVVAVILDAGLSGTSAGASQKTKSTSQTKSSGAATVQRRDLIATDTESGTLGYSDPATVFNRVSGTITSLPAVGQLVDPGGTLYQVDGAPVVLMNGTVPAYRTLSEGVIDGPDVQQLKQNLVALGFDPSHQITINQTYDAATVDAVERWQASLGQPQTGSVTLGQVVFLPGARRISAVETALGSNGSSGGSSGASGSSGSSGSSGTSGSSSASGSSGLSRARSSLLPSGWIRTTSLIFSCGRSITLRSSQPSVSPGSSSVPRASQLCGSPGLRR